MFESHGIVRLRDAGHRQATSRRPNSLASSLRRAAHAERQGDGGGDARSCCCHVRTYLFQRYLRHAYLVERYLRHAWYAARRLSLDHTHATFQNGRFCLTSRHLPLDLPRDTSAHRGNVTPAHRARPPHHSPRARSLTPQSNYPSKRRDITAATIARRWPTCWQDAARPGKTRQGRHAAKTCQGRARMPCLASRALCFSSSAGAAPHAAAPLFTSSAGVGPRRTGQVECRVGACCC